MTEKLPFPERFLRRVRVQWYLGGGGTGRGYICAIYSDGTCDVKDDVGPLHKGRTVRWLEHEDD